MFWDGILLYKTFLPFKYLYQTFMFSPLWSVIRRSTSGIEFPTMSGTNNEWARVSLFEYIQYVFVLYRNTFTIKTAEGLLMSFFLRIFLQNFLASLAHYKKLQLHWISQQNLTKLPISQNMSVPIFAIKAWKGNRKFSARL